MKLKISYNAPVTLTFAFIAVIVLALDALLHTNLVVNVFSIPGRNHFNFSSVFSYFRLFTHVIGHYDWAHLLGNFSFVLLLGPQLEEKYGSGNLLVMILITALATGLLNLFLVPNSLLAGASGIVFMMILLISFTRVKGGSIPLTFILIVILYLSKELIAAFKDDNVSQLAHIAGGILGSLFGFLKPAEPAKITAKGEKIPETPFDTEHNDI